ncbi:MAG TPA: Hpt domain-containing protein [Longimicrobiales bacterium]|nr:Hpt domain-containing protein [Longimicrobiales bacterium]
MRDAPVFDPAALQRLRRMGGGTLLRQLLEMYLGLGEERLAALAAGVESGDVRRVERAVHTLKATAGNVGAVRLQYTAAAIEEQAAAGVIDMELIGRVRDEYDASAAHLRDLLDSEEPE